MVDHQSKAKADMSLLLSFKVFIESSYKAINISSVVFVQSPFIFTFLLFQSHSLFTLIYSSLICLMCTDQLSSSSYPTHSHSNPFSQSGNFGPVHICPRYTTPAKCSRNKFLVHERVQIASTVKCSRYPFVQI